MGGPAMYKPIKKEEPGDALVSHGASRRGGNVNIKLESLSQSDFVSVKRKPESSDGDDSEDLEKHSKKKKKKKKRKLTKSIKKETYDPPTFPQSQKTLQTIPKLETNSSDHKNTHARSTSSGPGDTDSEAEDEKKPMILRPEEYEIKPKFKAEMNIDPITFNERMTRVDASQYPITLEPTSAQWQIVSRKFISGTYGGNSVSTYPKISARNVARHGRQWFMFWNLEIHPNAPKRPGEPGIWYDSGPIEYLSNPELVQHGFARMKSGQWLYLGDYKCCVTESLTQTEWLLQSDKFHRTWTTLIQAVSWGVQVRAAIHLRKELNREPTLEEISTALEGRDRFKDVTVQEIKDAFDQGKQRLGILVLKCVGYDNDFQKELIDKFSTWVPPPKKIKSKAKSKTKPGVKGKSRVKRNNRKQVKEEDSTEDSDSDMDTIYSE